MTAHVRVTAPIVLGTFREAAGQHGTPASTLTDNGMVYTTRFAGGRGGRTSLEAELRRLNVVQKNSRPNHPTTCGKVERFQQTLKKWLRAQEQQPATIDQLQTLFDRFREEYNQRRPHRSLPHRATPAAAYAARPKATPAGSRAGDTHDRTRHDRVDNSGCVTLRVNGRLHHIGVGRTHARTPSSCSSTTSTFASSTPPPESSSATWSSTPPATTSPPERPKAPPADPRNDHSRTCIRRSGCRRCLETSQGRGGGI